MKWYRVDIIKKDDSIEPKSVSKRPNRECMPFVAKKRIIKCNIKKKNDEKYGEKNK